MPIWPDSMTDRVQKGEVTCYDCGRVFTNTRQYHYAYRPKSANGIARVCKQHAPASSKGVAEYRQKTQGALERLATKDAMARIEKAKEDDRGHD